MLKFTTKETFQIKGRGTVHIVNESLSAPYWDPNHLTGETVELDGRKVVVSGVESFAIGRSPENPYRLSLGIMVKSI